MRGNFKNARPVLILLSGLPGSGKTTLAAQLSQRTSAVHVESDAIRHELNSSPDYTRAENHKVFESVERLAKEALIEGRSVIVDATNLDMRSRRRFIELSERLEVRVIGARVTAPLAVLRRRVSEEREGFSSAGPDVLEAMSGRPEPFRIPAVVFDSRFGAEASLELLSRLVNDQL